MNKIEFQMEPYGVDFELRPPITIIQGDSSTGKTLFYQWLDAWRRLPENKEKYANVVLLNHSSEINDILGKVGKLFVIDNADILLCDTPDVVEHISLDYDNQYVIICRRPYNFGMSPNHYATIVESDNKFTLSYEFNVDGWY